ncbi:hypothetical protein Dda_7280 [Drechslerella dactyloides]|uniref:Uncharacterized protein n=1 Tax=Drechslerella dactyloides TaxID=74499 RepID=A0AAD6IRY5_DREDA|nr:hypothetical protein Dda_7280 [Drechslerella dactyloides]
MATLEGRQVGRDITNNPANLKVVHKPLVVSDSGSLYSVTVSDNSMDDKENRVNDNDCAAGEVEEQSTKAGKEGECQAAGEREEAGVEAGGEKDIKSGNNGKETAKGNVGEPADGKRKRGRKPKAKDEGEGSKDQDSAPVKKRGGGRKRKDPADASNDGDKPIHERLTAAPHEHQDVAEAKRRRKAAPKKGAIRPLEALKPTAPPTPPGSPPPPTAAELATRAAKSAAEESRKERLRALPYYREEMKEIFDFLCDRGVYWRNDLPRNKRYSHRDTKLLEKEVRKKIAEILEAYPLEKEVMEGFEEEEKREMQAAGVEDAEGEKVGSNEGDDGTVSAII